MAVPERKTYSILSSRRSHSMESQERNRSSSLTIIDVMFGAYHKRLSLATVSSVTQAKYEERGDEKDIPCAEGPTKPGRCIVPGLAPHWYVRKWEKQSWWFHTPVPKCRHGGFRSNVWLQQSRCRCSKPSQVSQVSETFLGTLLAQSLVEHYYEYISFRSVI